MTWAGVLAAIDADVTAAGLTLTPKITVVRASAPVSIPENMIAYWYEGDQESTTGGNTFGKVNTQELVTVAVYWRVEDRKDTYAAALEVTARAANRAIQAALWGDVYLGGNAIGLDISPTRMGWLEYEPGRWARTLEIPLVIDMSETADIAV